MGLVVDNGCHSSAFPVTPGPGQRGVNQVASGRDPGPGLLHGLGGTGFVFAVAAVS